jgi:hypothetical protein
MDAKNPTSYSLRVEWLENRCLLSADTPHALAFGAALPSPPSEFGGTAYGTPSTVGFDAVPAGPPGASVPLAVRTAAEADSPVPVALGTGVPVGTGDGRTTAPGPLPVLPPPPAPADPRVLRLPDMGRDDLIRPILQQMHEDAHDPTVHDRTVSVPTPRTDSPGDGRPSMAVRVAGAPTGSLVLPDLVPVVADLTAGIPMPAAEADGVVTTPAETDPSTSASGALPRGSPRAAEPDAPDWHAALLTPLAGIALPGVAELDPSTLAADADAFLAHLAELGPDWAADVRWGEYACFTAAAALAAAVAFYAGGVGAGPAARRRTTRLPAEGVG